MPNPVRKALQAALAALPDDEPTTAAQRLAAQSGELGNGHNAPTTKEQRERNHEGGTSLSRLIAAQERYLARLDKEDQG